MKKCKKINYFLTVMLMAVSLPAFAIDTTQQDAGKLGGKFSDQVQKAKENYHQTVERISQSQYATAVGKGIKSAKQGMAWAQGKIALAMKVVSGVQNAVFNSREAKILMLTQQIASETKKLGTLKTNQKEQSAVIDENLKVEQEALKEKIKLSQENIETSMSVYEQELATAETDEEKAKIKEEIEKLQQGGSIEQAEFEKALKKLEDDAKAQKKALNEEMASQIYEQGEKIFELSEQYKDLIKQENVANGQTEQEPAQVIEESMDTFSFKKGKKVSLQDRKNKERSRKQRVTTTSIGAFNDATKNSASTDIAKAEQKTISDLGETMTGQSEAIQSAIKSTANQLDGLYNYLLTELKALEAETAVILSKSTIAVGEPRPNTDICHYSGKRGGILGAMDEVKGIQGTAMGAVTAVQGTVANATSVVSTATETISTATSTATGMINDSKNAATGIAGMGI